ncbi:MAG: response regulator transcription factor [Planctomycetia bacterium]|nr:response regulator transcription factor [Planctomycetia bacterium]
MRILVVEDEPQLLQVIARAMREQGYAVDEATNGQDALYKASTWDYDAILLDVMLPGLDGWAVLKELRKTKKTPVLMLTARDGIDDRVHGLDNGADDYIVKPFDLKELNARLRAVIRRSKGQAHPIIQLGSVTLHTQSRMVTLNGVDANLTALEYSLVEMLALQPGKLVTRTELYEHLFDESEDSMSNLIDVHVSNIRKKLGKDFIVTRRGQGYLVYA